jgi:restriction system protein
VSTFLFLLGSVAAIIAVVVAFLGMLSGVKNLFSIGEDLFLNFNKRIIKLIANRKTSAVIYIPPELLLDKKVLHEKVVDEHKNYNPQNLSYPKIKQSFWKSPAILNIRGRRISLEKNRYFSSRVDIPNEKKLVNIDDVKQLLVQDSNSIIEEISSAINSSAEYPVEQPQKQGVPKPPKLAKPEKLVIPEPSIKLSLYSGSYEFLNKYVYLFYKEDINRVKNAEYKRNSWLEKESKQLEEIDAYYQKSINLYEKIASDNERAYKNALTEWDLHRKIWSEGIQSDLIKLKELQALFLEENIATQAETILNLIELPTWIPTSFEIKFDNESNILIIEHQFPDLGEIFWKKNVELKSGLSEKQPNQKEIKQVCEVFYPSIVLKIAVELANQLRCKSDIAIVINGWADYTVKATGNKKRAYCASLMAQIKVLRELNLKTLDPLIAFNSLKGIAARSLELTPITPQVKINFEDKRFVEEKDILGKMSNEQNLASMNWEDFEHLCRELFEREFASSGSVVKVTQASRDQGVDAVIIDPHPIRGGKIVIQAKRYVNTVDVSSVRDLYGTLMNEGAMKGILVSTSNFGQDAYAFIQGKPLTLINGNELLGLLENHGYKYRINLDEARQFLKDASPFQSGNRYAGSTKFKESDDI